MYRPASGAFLNWLPLVPQAMKKPGRSLLSYTGTQSDYILPAAGWYEKTGIKYTVAHVPYVHYCDAAVPPLGESKDEYEIYWLLSREIERQAKTMDLPVFDGCGRGSIDWKTLHQRYSNHGALGQKDAEVLCAEILRSEATEGVTVADLKRTGIAKFTGTGSSIQASALHNPDWKGAGVLNTLTRFTEYKEPWPTYSGRITSFIDHPWFIEMREQFATHKDSPRAGGDYPFQFVSCHARWSIHSTWRDTPMMLRLQRGEPQVWLNPEEARKLGLEDYSYAELYNDYGSVRMRIKYSTTVRPGVAYYHHAWEPHQFPRHESFKWIIPGIQNPLHMAGGDSQLRFGINHLQVGTFVQDTRIGIRALTPQELQELEAGVLRQFLVRDGAETERRDASGEKFDFTHAAVSPSMAGGAAKAFRTAARKPAPCSRRLASKSPIPAAALNPPTPFSPKWRNRSPAWKTAPAKPP